jgi:uroporphyrinogen-III synthase
MAKSYILITRPTIVAKELCDNCRSLGLEVLHHPIIEIIPSYESIHLPDNAVAVFTSQNAVTTEIIKALAKDTQIFAVGDQTTSVLNQAGFENIIAASGNGIDLLEKLKKLPKNKSIIHFCGDILKVNIAVELTKLGYNAKALEVYQTKINTNFPDYITNALNQQFIDVLPVFSPRSAELLIEYFSVFSIKTESIIVICISQAVANVLANKHWKNIIIQPKITAELIYDTSIGGRLYA